MNPAVEAYLAERWPSGMPCPLCGGKEWASPPDGPHAIEVAPAAIGEDNWVFPVGMYLLICTGCGFIAPVHDTAVDAHQPEAETLDEAIKTVEELHERL